MRYVKLVEPPRIRLRVRDIAKELDVPPQDILDVLHDLHEYVKNSASFVEVPVIRRVHEAFDVTYHPRPQVAQPVSPSTRQVPAGLGPPPKREKRDNHPLMGEISPRRSRQAQPNAQPVSGTSAVSWTGRKADQQWAELRGGDASHSFEFESWKLYGFSEVERDVWIEAGLRPGQAQHAAELHEAGLSSTDLRVVLHGWTVADRLLRGEGAKAVARMLAQTRDINAG